MFGSASVCLVYAAPARCVSEQKCCLRTWRRRLLKQTHGKWPFEEDTYEELFATRAERRYRSAYRTFHVAAAAAEYFFCACLFHSSPQLLNSQPCSFSVYEIFFFGGGVGRLRGSWRWKSNKLLMLMNMQQQEEEEGKKKHRVTVILYLCNM